jgi:hypothetical protein
VAPSKFKVGEIHNAKYSGDGQFYRAKILAVDGKKYQVDYLDYPGSEEWLDEADIM